MAQINMLHSEGMHWVKMDLLEETVRAESGALSSIDGNITIEARLPSPWNAIKSTFVSESLVRPTYSGTGQVHLEGSLGGFHIVSLNNESWILESGSYWASDGSIDVSVFREGMWTSIWTGEGFVQYRTKVSGTGQVVVRTEGPAEEIALQSSRYLAGGKIVIGRTGDITYTLRRPTRSFFAYLLSGEPYLRCYEGTGRLLVCGTPYWRKHFQRIMRPK